MVGWDIWVSLIVGIVAGCIVHGSLLRDRFAFLLVVRGIVQCQHHVSELKRTATLQESKSLWMVSSVQLFDENQISEDDPLACFEASWSRQGSGRRKKEVTRMKLRQRWSRSALLSTRAADRWSSSRAKSGQKTRTVDFRVRARSKFFAGSVGAYSCSFLEQHSKE